MSVARELLLVEDNPGDADFILELLGVRGAAQDHVVHVETLAAAVSRIETSAVDAVLLDLKLPDGAGVECVSRIRAVRGELPIVVLTGTDDEALAMSCIRAGAQDYLSKGEIRHQLLTRAIGYAIARSAESQQKQRADSLQARLAAIVEGSPDAIVSCSVDGVVTSWNPSAERIFGVSADEALGRPIRLVLPFFEDFEGDLEGVAAGMAQQRAWQRRDGVSLTLSCVTSALRDVSGRVSGLAAIYRDITEQKALEVRLALADRMVSIGTLAAGVAHEINNPLSAVIVNLELIAEQVAELALVADLMETLDDELRDAREGAERVRKIVQDLKLFSRDEGAEAEAVDLRRVIDSTVRLASNEVKHRAKLVLELAEVPPVRASEARLGQVILNLVMNAAQAIPAGNRDANEIRITTSVDARGRVLIEVSDTGLGMSAEVQHNLFTAFYTTKAVGAGTGLGLAISQRIVTSFGGEIGFESAPGLGSRFVVALLPAESPGEREAAPPETMRARRARVLFIDDERALLRAAERLLPDDDVTCCEGAVAALERLRRGETYDVIFCDLMMPNQGGDAFHAAVAAMGLGLERRIVFMTGGAFTPRGEAFLGSVPNPRLDKPFGRRQLRKAIREMLK